MGDEFLCLVICLLNWNAPFPRFLQASTGRRLQADVAKCSVPFCTPAMFVTVVHSSDVQLLKSYGNF